MGDTKSYYHSLAFHLRQRHLPEAEVTRILAEVHELCCEGEIAPADEFGPAQQYAAQFAQRKRRYDVGTLVFIGCVLVCGVITLMNVLARLGVGDRLLPLGLAVLAYVVLLAGGAAFAIGHGRRLPRELRRRLGQQAEVAR
ncbi:hypothetical protein ACFQ46_22645 [Kineococcus sp. GCM10028916]|uniref:hypothetical protein n=1 Tax=Kineococcus sp. GCM10028916 TaxID=3273394 RepID=UPI003641DAC6